MCCPTALQGITCGEGTCILRARKAVRSFAAIVIQFSSALLAIVAVTLLLFSRQTVVVIYAIFILLASIDAFNAARQGVKLRIYVYLVILAVYVPISLLYAVTLFLTEADVVCASADNIVTCESVSNASATLVIIMAFTEAGVGTLVFFAVPGIGVGKHTAWQWS